MYYIQPFYSIMNDSESKVDDQVKEYKQQSAFTGRGREAKIILLLFSQISCQQTSSFLMVYRKEINVATARLCSSHVQIHNKWVIVLKFTLISSYRIRGQGHLLYITIQKCAFNTLEFRIWLRRLNDTGCIDPSAVVQIHNYQ